MSWTSEVEMFADVRNVTRARSTWKRIGDHLRAFWARMIVLVLLAAFGVVASVGQPLLFREALDVAIAPESARAGLSLGWIAVLVLLIGLLQVAAAFVEQRRRAALAEDIASETRDALLDRLQLTTYAFFVHASPGAVFQRIWDESARAAGSTAVVLTDGARSILIIVAAPIFFAVYDIRLALGLIVLGLFLVPSSWIRRRIRAVIVEQVSAQSKYSGLLHENLSVSGAVLTRVFGLQDQNRDRARAQATRYRDLGLRAASWQALNQATIGLGLALAIFIVVWIGGDQVSDGRMGIGDLVLLLFFLRIIAQPLQTYSQLRFELIRGFVAFGRLFEVLDLDPEQRPADGSGAVPEQPGHLAFESVSFRYPTATASVPSSLAVGDQPRDVNDGGDLVLEDISFSVTPGALVALAGSSGSGKSTIAALGAGLYGASEGRVLLGGVDIRDLDRATLSSSVGIVTQDTHLVHDTIRNNLLLARPDASDKEVVKACVAAGIHGFIRSLPNSYGTVVGERGVRLSGGQRQRIAFARVLLRDPAVVILDEATAHLDTEAEALLREAIDKVLAGRTRLVIAHRLSTIVGADEVLVLEGGRIVERGDHQTLMGAGGRYEQLYRTQFMRDDASGSPSNAATVAEHPAATSRDDAHREAVGHMVKDTGGPS